MKRLPIKRGLFLLFLLAPVADVLPGGCSEKASAAQRGRGTPANAEMGPISPGGVAVGERIGLSSGAALDRFE